MAWAQAINHSQELSDLISKKKWFEIENYYQQHKESIDSDFVKIWYFAETENAFNRPYEAISTYEKLIDNIPLNMDKSTLASLFGHSLQLCSDVQEYEKGEEFCQKIITVLEKNTAIDSDTRLSGIQTFTPLIERFKLLSKTFPKLTITKSEVDNTEKIKLIPDTLTSSNNILFNAKWNGIELLTEFDTGSGMGAYIYNRAIAEKIGVKLNAADTIIVNEGYELPMRCLAGVVDSLKIGDFNIKNVTVAVNIDAIDSIDSVQVECDSVAKSMYDIILGFSVIRQLGVIEFDFVKNTMSFPQDTKTVNEKNLYIDKNVLFMNMKICDANFLSFFDTGGAGQGLLINTDFYEKHKQCISVESQATQDTIRVGNCNETSLKNRDIYKCPQIEVEINNQIITMKNDCNVSKNKENNTLLGTVEGGYFGNSIFKYCKKATFDFDNMVFSVDK